MFATLAYRAAEGVVGLLPRPTTEFLARAAAHAAFVAGVPARRHLEANLARLLPAEAPERRRRHARAAFEHFALSFVDFLALSRQSRQGLLDAIDVRGLDHLEAARRSGRGVLVLSAHLGCWERAAAWLAATGPPVALAARAHEPGVERLFARRRGAFGVHVLPAAARLSHVSGALRRGAWVAVMADRGATGEARSGSVCEWAGALARRTGAIVLPMVTVRDRDGRHALLVGPVLDAERCRAGALRGRLREWLREHVDQWSAFEPLPEGLA